MNLSKLTPAVVVLTTSLAACGGGGGGGGDALKKDDLAKKANTICTQAGKDVNALKAPTNVQDAGQAAAYFDKAAPIIDKETKDLKALKPADDVKADWNAFIDAQSAANDLLQQIKEKADKKDASGLKDLQKLQTLGDAVQTTAKKVGATACAS